MALAGAPAPIFIRHGNGTKLAVFHGPWPEFGGGNRGTPAIDFGLEPDGRVEVGQGIARQRLIDGLVLLNPDVVPIGTRYPAVVACDREAGFVQLAAFNQLSQRAL